MVPSGTKWYMVHEDEDMGISDGLRTELEQVWALGFLDAMNGARLTDADAIPPRPEVCPPCSEHSPPSSEVYPPSAQEYPATPQENPHYAMYGRPVTDEDTIPSALAPHLRAMAQVCIAKAEEILAEMYRENPQTVLRTVYEVGWVSFARIEQVANATEINLN